MKCDRCDAPISGGNYLDVWDENGAWLRYCGWPCIHAIAVLRRGA